MGMSGAYVDTGDFYGMGHNELLLAEALRGRDRDGYVLSVKFGMLRAARVGESPATETSAVTGA